MLVVGVGNYVQSMRALDDLIFAKLQAASEQGALEIGARYREARSALIRLSRSSHAEQLYAMAASGPVPGDASFWREIPLFPAEKFESVEFRDAGGAVLQALDSPEPGIARPTTPCPAGTERSIQIRVPVVLGAEPAGMIIGRLRSEALLPPEALGAWFGRNGQRLVVDRSANETVYDARCVAGGGPSLRSSPAGWKWPASRATVGRVVFTEGGIEKAGAFVAARDLPWLVVSAADMDEFAGPYREAQLVFLGFVMLITVGAGGAFLILAQRMTRSLEDLTDAADRIGEGDLMPSLPTGRDEVGRLSHSFNVMLARLQAMIRQNEAARRLAVTGEVAAQLSHEIRNPLSSIRLNLQSLARETGTGAPPADLAQVLRLCLREINRLDEAVSTVLDLGQPRPPERRPCHLSEVVDDALDVVRSRLLSRRIEIDWDDRAERDLVAGDAGQLKGLFLNLLLNALEAMPSGGVLWIWSENGRSESGQDEVRVHIADTGDGIQAELRGLVFEPFYTTKVGGSGIGLAVARQTAEAHGGRLYLDSAPVRARGAEFVLALPLTAAGESSEDVDGALIGAAGPHTGNRWPWREPSSGSEGLMI